MRIQHNIMSMNAYRNYNTNTSALSKNLEKLSSGYKINRAGDDAAGLAISEKMRAQITGLNAAQKNVKDGISLVKTAEGAMQEIQDMLNRMDYLATQSANGTYDNEVDRYNLQKEVNQLRSEINRIADSANFNGIKLLNGDMSLSEADRATVDISVSSSGVTAGVEAAGGTFAGTALNTHFVPSSNGIDGLHPGSPVVTPTDATFTIDISGITVTGISSGGAAVDVKISVGGANLTASVTHASATSVNGTAIGTALMNAYSAGGVTIGGVNFKISSATNGKLTFVATTAGDCDGHADAINAALQTEVAVTVSGGVGNKGGLTGTWVHGVDDITKAVDTAPLKLGGISFKLDGNIVADGNKLTIGDKTYIFKVGKDTAVTAASSGNNIVVDLTKYEGEADGLYTAAAIELAKSATNITNGQVTVAGGTTVTTTFKISSVDGQTIHIDQQKQTGSTEDVTYNADMLKNLFTLHQEETSAVKASMSLSGVPAAANDLKAGDLVSYQTTDADGNTITKSYTIGTAPKGASSAEAAKYKTVEEFNALLADDAKASLKKAAESVIEKSYGGQYEVKQESDGSITLTATAANKNDTTNKLEEIRAAIESAAKINISKISKENAAKGGLTLQIGDTSDSFNQLRVNVGDMHVNAMGTMETTVEGGKQTPVDGQSINDIDISTQAGAQAAVDVIKNAINYVSSIRGDLGATQNRLEHTANNLSVMAENIQDAESTIRDTDVAEEMMAYTKNNILVQSAQAMLAQANAVPQGVLQLLG